MNLVLFESSEIDVPLPRADRRAAHILEVLHRQIGEEFDVGLINGPRGKATLVAITERALSFAFHWDSAPPPLDPLVLLVGLPRPQTARDLLREMTTLGVSELHFVATEKTERGYATSSLWSSGEWRRHVVAGAEQAFDTRIPEVSWNRSLLDVLATRASGGICVALDNYEGASAFGKISFPAGQPITLAIGSERGWSAQERRALREHHFTLAHLGPRVLRVETAAIAALSIIRANRGTM